MKKLNLGLAKISRRLLSGMAVVVLGGIASSTLFSVSAHAQAPSQVLKVAAYRHPTSLDPITGSSGNDHVFLYPAFDTLIGLDPQTLKLRPELATSWEFPNENTLVLKIRPNVTFHDGTPLDAAAVKFNLDRSRSSERSNVKAELSSVSAVEVTGPLTVTVRLKSPDTSLPGVLSDRAGMMVSPKAIQAMGAGLDRVAVGTGPWKFASWTNNDRLVFEKNTKYWKSKLPHLDRLEFVYISDVTTGLRSVIAGENDFVYALSPQQKSVAERGANMVAASTPTIQTNMMYMNYGKPPLNDVRVRKALNMAIDRRQFTAVTTLGLGLPASSLLPPEYWAAAPGIVQPHDIEQAKKLLAEAGYANGLTLSVVGLTDQIQAQRAEILISALARVGIKLNVTRMAASAALNRFFNERQDDLYLASWTGRADPSASLTGLFGTNAFFNAGKVDPTGGKLMKAIEDTRSVNDPVKRKAVIDVAQKIIFDEALYVPLNFEALVYAHSKKVQGFVPNLLGKPRFDEVSIK
jgi:peptide/nickel transport system permease protein/peptide/nickel transport system substrate-binding protein